LRRASVAGRGDCSCDRRCISASRRIVSITMIVDADHDEADPGQPPRDEEGELALDEVELRRAVPGDGR
jgi:hypothetical protein